MAYGVLPALLVVPVVGESGEINKSHGLAQDCRHLSGKESNSIVPRVLVHDEFVDAAQCQPLLGRITDGHGD